MRGWPIIAIRALVGEASPIPFDHMIDHVAARFLRKRLTENVDIECLILGRFEHFQPASMAEINFTEL